jgi:predicted Zn-dependent protease with MMP-like domain/Flp pilus assembly protein TadD
MDSLLDEASNALDDGRFEDALEKADDALKQEPDDLEALGLRAAALAELGRWEDADAVYARLIAREPDEPSWVLAAADVMIRQPGDDQERLEAGMALLAKIERLAAGDERLHFEWLMLQAISLNQLGELEGALQTLEKALKLSPDEPEAKLERAVTLFDLGRFAPAKAELTALAEELPEDPWPPHYLGLLAERAGDEAKAKALFAKATQLDPDAFPPAVVLSEAQFDAAVKEAIAKLPEHAKAELGNVTISVEPFPDDESLGSGEVTPTILGVFHGTPVDERSPLVAEHHLTAQIVLYQRNLERFARSHEELIEQIGVTVLHEVGHLLGLDEDELYDRGLD